MIVRHLLRRISLQLKIYDRYAEIIRELENRWDSYLGGVIDACNAAKDAWEKMINVAQRECNFICAATFYCVLVFISRSAMGGDFFETVNNDFLLIDKTVSKLNVYLDGLENDELISIQEDIDLTVSIAPNVYEYYSSGMAKNNIFKDCYFSAVYNSFSLYGQYLSQYRGCVEEGCKDLPKLKIKMLMVIESIEGSIKVCREELKLITK